MRLRHFAIIAGAAGAVVAALTALPPRPYAGPRQLLGVGPTSSGGGGSNWTLVNHTSCQNVAGANCSTASVDMTAGGNAKIIIIGFAYECTSNVAFAGAPTDTSGNTYVMRSRSFGTSGDSQCAEIWDSISPTVTSSMAFAFQDSNSPQYPSFYVAGFREAATPAFGAVVASNSGSAATVGTSFQPGSITPAFSNALVVTVLALSATTTESTGIAVDSGFSITDKSPDTVFYAGGLAWIQQTTAAAVNPTWSWVVANPALALIATFQ